MTTALMLGLTLFLGGCGKTAQQEAYEHAAQMEAQFTTENAPTIVTEYQHVIAMNPGTSWAQKAQARIEAVQARVQTEEQHKSVFQEHGID